MVMKPAILCFFAALLCLLSGGCVSRASAGEQGGGQPGNGFVLDAKTTIRNGIREYAETVYTFSQKFSGGTSRELWRITLNDKYEHHWIAPDGKVWVLTSSMPGPGGGGHVWVRDAQGSLLATWQAYYTVLARSSERPAGPEKSALDLAASSLKVLGQSGTAQQLRLRLGDGSESRLTLADAETGRLALVRQLKRSDGDLLTEMLSRSYSPARVNYPAQGGSGLVQWQFQSNKGQEWLETACAWSGVPSDLAPKRITGERLIPSFPTYAAKTPAGHLLEFFFPFAGREATLDILTVQGKLLSSIDLLALGHFGSKSDAKMSLRYREVEHVRGAGPGVSIEDADYSSYGEPETLRMIDRSGREYRISIGVGENAVVNATASYNIKSPQSVEPKYPTAPVLKELIANSPDGRFTVRCRELKTGLQPTRQLTLVAHVADPVKGRVDAEVWSNYLPSSPQQLFVSNSGRVFAFYILKTGSPNPNVPAELALLSLYESKGTQLGIDVVRQKWADTVEQAQRTIDLAKMSTSLEGAEGKTDLNNIPLPVWPIEHVSVPFGSSQAHFQIHAGPVPNAPPMILLRP